MYIYLVCDFLLPLGFLPLMKYVQKLHFRMLHGTNSLAEEKRLLKETINANPPKTSTGGAMSIRNSLRSKQATHDDVKVNSPPLKLIPNITDGILSKCMPDVSVISLCFSVIASCG